ncbi:uncharacterized protein BKA55DRAFT_547471 [Fusarium redolens]|uniref:Uncharacterized protein n=1 Tax=Fusarium redolens TaxID=48865 RepID=A0A9P9FW74_FUSRE|nr:uncharacterized protein BKA55DRAFT_547471 [Fusarium redolens]KAH7202704.1 hypothetical protein BKA55DRAFT_547471 [Fusarium redolens]
MSNEKDQARYAEVLDNTQFAFIATIHKLYSMVVNNQPWELGEPELNNHGQPIIHSIAQKLGCIRPQSDIELPMEDKDADFSVCNRTDQGPLSPQTFTYSTNDFGFAPPLPDIDAAAKCPPQSPSMSNFPAWLMTAKSQLSNLTMQFMQQPGPLGNVDQWHHSLAGWAEIVYS